MSERIEVQIIPTFKKFPRSGADNPFKIYTAVPSNNDSRDRLTLDPYDCITIKGKMQNLTLDAIHKAKVEESNDPKWGKGYIVHEIYEDVPESLDGQHNFLKSMMTELQLAEIYKVYPNTDIIELFKTNKFDFNKVKGLGSFTYEKIKKRILDNLEWKSLFSELGKYGIKYETMKKLVEMYGTAQAAIEAVQCNPYILTKLKGIGFKKADKIAVSMGIDMKSPFRIHAGIFHVVKDEENSGHTYIERDKLITKAIELLVIDRGYIVDQINEVEDLYIEEDKIALYKTYKAEKEIADMLVRRLKRSAPLQVDVDKFLDEQEKELEIKLTKDQRRFFYNFRDYNVNFLVGYAGVGKSFMQKLLINFIKKINSGEIDVVLVYENKEKKSMSYRLLAPTGRAAKVLSNYVDGADASTIHRAIGYGRKHDAEDEGVNDLTEDTVLGDEMSMADVRLVHALLKKITNDNARIIFIGDDFQIASVGAGNFLKDCLDSNVFPVVKLDKVFRQEEGGGLDIATKIRQGIQFLDDDFVGEKKYGKDAIVRSVDQMHMAKGYQHYYKMFLKMFDPTEIMVLSSTKKGDLGTVSINKYIQSIVNPFDIDKKEIKYHDDCTFRVGDYVMNTSNTYEIRDINGQVTDIVNGDSGIIIDIVNEQEWAEKEKEQLQKSAYYNDDFDFMERDEEVKTKEYRVGIYIQFDVGIISIPFERMEQLMHSWALTKHKSQGGSAKAVIVVADKAHKFQLNANLLYTGLTRFKEYLVVLCQAETLNYALRKFENKMRKTFLKELLVKEMQRSEE